MSGWPFLNLAMANSTKPIVLPVAGDYNIAFSDIQFIKYTLAGILLSTFGFIAKYIFEMIFKKQDGVDLRLDKVIESLTRLEGNVSYLERHTVKKEDLIMLVRSELKYRKSVKRDDEDDE